MNITRSWKKILAVSCSHGSCADPAALAAVLKFKADFKPQTVIHLGDFIDLPAMRSGAKGSSDESEPIRPDLDAGLDFLDALGANIVFAGNHEVRLWRLREHHNAIISELSSAIIERIEYRLRKRKAAFHLYDGIWQGIQLGNYRFMHGAGRGGMGALRQHANAYGNCVIGHLHCAAMESGSRIEGSTAFCAGALVDAPNMDYASQNINSTLRWNMGFVWGEYCADLCQLYLHVQPRGLKEWRLPI